MVSGVGYLALMLDFWMITVILGAVGLILLCVGYPPDTGVFAAIFVLTVNPYLISETQVTSVLIVVYCVFFLAGRLLRHIPARDLVAPPAPSMRISVHAEQLWYLI